MTAPCAKAHSQKPACCPVSPSQVPGQVRGRAVVLGHSLTPLDASGRPDSYVHLAFCQPRFKRRIDPGRRKLEVRMSVLLVTTYVGHVVKSEHMNEHPSPLSPTVLVCQECLGKLPQTGRLHQEVLLLLWRQEGWDECGGRADPSRGLALACRWLSSVFTRLPLILSVLVFLLYGHQVPLRHGLFSCLALTQWPV